MITIAKTKEILNDPEISNQEAQTIRDCLYNLAEIALESWQSKQNLDCSNKICYNNNVDPV